MNKKLRKFLRRLTMLNVVTALVALYLLLVFFPDFMRVFESPTKTDIQAEVERVTPLDELQFDSKIVKEEDTQKTSQEQAASIIVHNSVTEPEVDKITDLAKEVSSSELINEAVLEDSNDVSKVDIDIIPREKPDPARETQTAIQPEGNKIINGVAWLAGQPSSHYTLQLESFRDPIILSDYARNKRSLDSKKLRQLDSSSGWFYLLYGVYANADEARAARTQFEGRGDVMIRNIGELQKIRCKNLGLEITSAACWNSGQ